GACDVSIRGDVPAPPGDPPSRAGVDYAWWRAWLGGEPARRGESVRLASGRFYRAGRLHLPDPVRSATSGAGTVGAAARLPVPVRGATGQSRAKCAAGGPLLGGDGARRAGLYRGGVRGAWCVGSGGMAARTPLPDRIALSGGGRGACPATGAGIQRMGVCRERRICAMGQPKPLAVSTSCPLCARICRFGDAGRSGVALVGGARCAPCQVVVSCLVAAAVVSSLPVTGLRRLAAGVIVPSGIRAAIGWQRSRVGRATFRRGAVLKFVSGYPGIPSLGGLVISQ